MQLIRASLRNVAQRRRSFYGTVNQVSTSSTDEYVGGHVSNVFFALTLAGHPAELSVKVATSRWM